MRHWWLLLVLVVLVAGLGAGAGYGLRELSARAGDEPTPAPPSTTTTSRGDEPGSRAVQLAPDVMADPGSAEIQKLLQRHFDAINNRDFDAWQATVSRQRAAAFPRQQWLNQYRSTRDGAIVVHRIEPTTTGGSVVLISFTSMQDRALAPNQLSDCLRWRVGYVVIIERGELRLGPSNPDASHYEAC